MIPPTFSSIFTVSRLNQSVRELLEMEMGVIWLSGEISNFSQPASGHWYFTLKDERAQVRCAMFRNNNRHAAFRPQNGQQVLVRAAITLYEPRGDYQLIAENMQPAGDGLLQQQFEQLKQRLATQGLFAQEHKKPIPRIVKCVGVITSASGAALHDILHILKRRDPLLPVIIYPTAVQGEDAPLQIVNAIKIANQRAECDVLIVGRGGGSLEDLWSFNDERVARAIFASQLAIISAVGHETDVTIADLVADLRAPTPSAAAELVSQDQKERIRHLDTLRQRLEMAIDYYLAQRQQYFLPLYHRLQQQHPQLRLARQQTLLLKLQKRLEESMKGKLNLSMRKFQHTQQQLELAQPLSRLHHHQQLFQQSAYHLQHALTQCLHSLQQRFGIACSQLEAVSPLATLARGYSITQTSHNVLLKNTTQVQLGTSIKTRLQDGWIESQVTAIDLLKNNS